MIWMSQRAVLAAARGLIFTHSFLFLMAVSSDESGTHEGVRRELAVQFCHFSSFLKKKKNYRHFEPLGEI